MTPEQALTITRLARAAWPAQRWDEYTIDVWAKALTDTTHEFGETRAAIDRLVTKQTFASIAEIFEEVRAHRRDAARQISERRTFAAIESARVSALTPEQVAARAEEARQAVRAKLAETRAAG